MSDEIKSGQEIITEFFAELENENQLDSGTVDAILELYKDGKFSATNISNALSSLRQEQASDED